MNRAVDTIVRDQNITVILAAHRLSTIAQAERVIVLENGVVSEEGPYSVLVSLSIAVSLPAPGPNLVHLQFHQIQASLLQMRSIEDALNTRHVAGKARSAVRTRALMPF